jgi:hypothetical protein
MSCAHEKYKQTNWLDYSIFQPSSLPEKTKKQKKNINVMGPLIFVEIFILIDPAMNQILDVIVLQVFGYPRSRIIQFFI